MRRILLVSVIVSVLILPVLAGPVSAGKEIKLAIASWNVPKDPNSKVLQTIADDLAAVSGGQIKAEISYKALGKPQDYYDAVYMGICDIAYVGLPYTPGQFPFSEMLGLPIRFPDNTIATKAHFMLWQKGYLDKQFADVQPLCVGSTSPYNFLWGKTTANSLAEFKGKKIRCPGGPWTAMTEAIGGIPVSISAAESYMAAERGVIDGILQVWPAVPVFKLSEVCKNVTEMNLSGFGFAILMNKSRFDKLPDEAKKMLIQNKEKYTMMMGEAHHRFNQFGMKMMLDAGGKINKLSDADAKELNRRLKPLFEKWVKDMNKRNLPGEKALDDMYDFLISQGVKEPFER